MAQPDQSKLESRIDVELVPGTEVMTDVGDVHFQKSKHSHVVLIPQPSNDPRDPLNWSRKWKSMAIGSMIYITFAQILGPLAISPVFPELAMEFNSDLQGVIQFTASTILALGFASFLWVPISDTFGRRPVLLLSTLVTIAGTATRAAATSYKQFMIGSVFLGIGTGQALQPAIIADVIFLHERGFFNTLFFTTFFVGLQVGPIIQGAMAQTVGWRSFWWLNTALNVVAFFVILFAFPETLYRRSTESAEKDIKAEAVAVKASSASSEEKEPQVNASETDGASSQDTAQSQNDVLNKGAPSWGQYRPFQSNDRPLVSLLKGIYLPFKLFTFPIIPWAFLVHSFASACYLLITLFQAQAFTPPPYNFSPLGVGFTNFAPLVGTLIGLFTAGPASDWVSMKLTKRNGGIREPEMRLVTMIPYVAIMLLGNFVTAFGLQQQWDWKPIVIVGFTCAGIEAPALSSISATYAIDSYKPAAGSIFILTTFARDIWGYGLSYFVTEWSIKYGYVAPFMLNMGLLCLWLIFGVFIWAFGKKLRRFTAKSWVHRMNEAS